VISDELLKPWAIRREIFETMLEVFDRHARGEGFNRAAVEAAIGKPLNNQPQPYQVIDGVAVLNLVGVLGKRMNLFAEISGGTSTQLLQQQLATALSDPTAHSILLYIDSPGGEIDGTQALATDVFNARARKRIVAVGEGQIASAAYWIGSAAERLYIADDTTVAGSIGVIGQHVDMSRAQEMRGVKTTEITAGKYKRIASSFAPLSDEGRQTIQDVVDHIYGVMVDDIARNRGTNAQTVLRDMADGRLFLGQQAVDAGLVDGFGRVDALIAMLAQNSSLPTTGTNHNRPGGVMERQTISASQRDSRNLEDVKEIAEAAKALKAKEEAVGRELTIEAAVRRIRKECGLPDNPAPIEPVAEARDDRNAEERKVMAHAEKLAARATRLVAEARAVGISLDPLKANRQAREELGDAPR
jgi:signal peptide peptidase SppA